MQPGCTPFPIWKQCVVPCPVLLLLPDLHTDFSRGRSGGLVFPSLSEFSTVRPQILFLIRNHQLCQTSDYQSVQEPKGHPGNSDSL